MKYLQYRQQIINVLSQKRHLRVEELFRTLKRTYSVVSIATIYRNLKTLEKRGEIIGFLHPDGAIRYELKGSEDHQHLICETCGDIIEIRFGFMEELSENLQKRANFHLHPHRLSMVGRCASCK